MVNERINMVYGDEMMKGITFLKYLTEILRPGSETDYILKNSVHRAIRRLV